MSEEDEFPETGENSYFEVFVVKMSPESKSLTA
jgi:hypothetical protein